MSIAPNASPTSDSAPEGSGAAEINETNLDPNYSSESQIEGSAPSTKAELKEAIVEAAENGASKKEIQQMIKEYEIKVNGKSKKVKIDLGNEKEVIRALQMAYAGQGAMQEKAELEKLMNQALMTGKQDPDQFLQDYLGIDPEDYMEKRIQRRIEDMKKSPEVLEKEQIMKEVAKLREELSKKENAAKEEQEIRMSQQASYELDLEIKSALEAHPDLPKTRKTVMKIADGLLWALNYRDDNGQFPFKDATVHDILPSIKAEIKRENIEFMSALPEEMLEEYIGKAALDKLRKKRAAAAKVVPQNVAPQAQANQKAASPKEKIDARNFFRNIGKV
jgi:hypothetical protein